MHASLVVIRSRTTRLIAGVVLVLSGSAVALAGPVDAQERILEVPGDHPTIQEAVDAAAPGDMILVAPGVYHEAVTVGEAQAGITIRGLDRNEVVLDGRDPDSGEVVLPTGILIHADDVTVENMTARYYQANGFKWESVDGFVGRYLTAHNHGLYGIYGFDSTNGLFEDSYASGVADAAFYIGQCNPCNTTIRRVVAQHSALGFSGSNASGELILEDSEWSHNGAGIIPNTLDGQRYPPQGGATIRNNLIHSNGNIETPAIGYTGAVIGMGVGIAGGNNNLIEGNEIRDNSQWGIVIFPMPDDSFWTANNNQIRNNTLRDNGSGNPAEDNLLGYADLGLAAAAGEGNCFDGNDYGSSAPPSIEDAFPCDGPSLGAVPGAGDPRTASSLARDYATWSTGQHDRDNYSFEDMPEPGPQTTMPDADPRTAAAEQEPGDTETEVEDQELVATTPLPATGAGAGMMLLGAALMASAVAGRRAGASAG